MKKKYLSAVSLLVLLVSINSPLTYADIVLTSFSPSEYLGGDSASIALMRTNLGLDDFLVEDFASLTLPTGRLQFTGVGGVISENGHSWGQTGTGFVSCFTDPTTSFTVSVAGGTSLLGIGFSAFESGTVGSMTFISVDGGAPIPLDATTLPSFSFSSTIRNGYMVLKTNDGSLFENVEFTSLGTGDGYQIDYIAYTAVPEPSQIFMFFVVATTLALIRIRSPQNNTMHQSPRSAALN